MGLDSSVVRVVSSSSGSPTAPAPAPTGMPRWPVLVLPTREHKGLNTLADGTAPEALLVDFEEAFTKHWDTDAHYTGYLPHPLDPASSRPVSQGGEGVYRLNKPVLPEIRAAGGDIHTRLLTVEYDTPGHQPWTLESWESFQAGLGAIRGLGADLFYTTRAGARWVTKLSEPVLADQAEDLTRGLWREYREAGLQLDETPVLATWPCLFRLPCVTRDGEKTWENPFFVCDLAWGDPA